MYSHSEVLCSSLCLRGVGTTLSSLPDICCSGSLLEAPPEIFKKAESEGIPGNPSTLHLQLLPTAVPAFPRAKASWNSLLPREC